jgi:hypothetical protein
LFLLRLGFFFFPALTTEQILNLLQKFIHFLTLLFV